MHIEQLNSHFVFPARVLYYLIVTEDLHRDVWLLEVPHLFLSELLVDDSWNYRY